MTGTQKRWVHSPTRRLALKQFAALLAGSPLVSGQQDPFHDHSRIPSLDELEDAFDFEPVAYAKLPRATYDYTAYGTESEFTLRRNRQAFEWVELAERKPIDAKSVQTGIELFGKKLAYPILVAPSATHVPLHPDGEGGTYQGATSASGTPFIISNNASMAVDKIAAAAKGTIWWQLYPKQDPDVSRELLETAQANGAQAIVVTLDQQSSVWERALHDRNLGGRAPARRARAGGSRYRISTDRLWYRWSYLEQIRPLVKVRMLAKGVLTPEAASECVQHGVDGIIVSNHGGRSMDYAPSTLEALPEIVEAVGGRVPILIDSGFRRGTDVIKALALGANAVCLGRVPRWGLAAYGAPGVQRVLELMQKELRSAMAQSGCATIGSIDRTVVRSHFS